MVFSSEVKDELSRIMPAGKCCKLAELSAIFRMDGAFHILAEEDGRYALHISTERAGEARKVIKFLSSLFNLKTEIEVKHSLPKKANEYVVFIPPQRRLRQTLNELGILDDNMVLEYSVLPRLVKGDCCKMAYLRGAFLGGGFVSNPKGAYRFELTTDNKELSESLLSLLRYFGLRAKLSVRRGSFVVYLAKVEEIVHFLSLVGAYNALLEWEDIRIFKGIRNQINRLVNCETANLDKTVGAAIVQLSDIATVSDEVGLTHFSKALQDVAYARLKNPRVSIRELGKTMNPSLSKSAVYHRLRRLSKAAENLKKAS